MRFPDLLRYAQGFFSRNRGLKLLALGLSVVLWWFVVGENKIQVGFAVPLEFRNIPNGMTITNKVERQVEVRLSGPPSLLGSLPQSEVSAEVNLSSARVGRQVVYLDERSVKIPTGIRVQRIYPNAIEVVVEKLVRRQLPVVARVGGGPQLRRRIDRIEVSPASLEVEALPDEFSRLRALHTEEVVPEVATGVFATRARVELREGHAKIVGNPTVRVTVRFRD